MLVCSLASLLEHGGNYSAVPYLPINHVGDHHDLVCLRIRKLQREFGSFNVKGKNNRILSRTKSIRKYSKADLKLKNGSH